MTPNPLPSGAAGPERGGGRERGEVSTRPPKILNAPSTGTLLAALQLRA
jgi:hypothetical protein